LCLVMPVKSCIRIKLDALDSAVNAAPAKPAGAGIAQPVDHASRRDARVQGLDLAD
jgi:hypothetical protein